MESNSSCPSRKVVVGEREEEEQHLFHVIFKVPSGDGPYVRAKHAQVPLSN